MKKHTSLRLLAATAGAVLALGLATASAQAYYTPVYPPPPSNDVGFYLGGDLGPAFMQDIDTSRFGFPGTFVTRPGVRFGIEPGFNFIADNHLTLGAEFETGLIYNYIYRVRNAGADTGMHGDSYQAPVLGNLILKLHVDPMITPYFGVGGGGDYSSIRLFNHHDFNFHSHTTDDEFDPAVQGIVGVRFRLNPITELGFEYKYLAAFPDQGSTIQTHAILASFTIRF